MGSCYGNRDDVTEGKRCLGLGEVTHMQKDGWEQIGIQSKNWSRWLSAEVQARLVAQSFTQKYKTYFDETFCPVVRQESLCLLMVLSVQHGLTVHQVDVTTTFFYGTLEEVLHVKKRRSLYAS